MNYEGQIFGIPQKTDALESKEDPQVVVEEEITYTVSDEIRENPLNENSVEKNDETSWTFETSFSSSVPRVSLEQEYKHEEEEDVFEDEDDLPLVVVKKEESPESDEVSTDEEVGICEG